MILDHRYHQLTRLKATLSGVAYGVQGVLEAPYRLWALGSQYTRSYKTLQHENETLKQTHFLLTAEMQKFKALEAENERLRALLQSAPPAHQTLLVAEIIQTSADPFNHRVLLNRGQREGVRVGQPVIDAEGVVGEVVEVYPKVSRVILLTDVSYGIAVENVRNGVRGIAVGTGDFKILHLQHVPNTVDLLVGDTLVTSGLDGRYSPGYPVGTVRKIDHDPGESFARVEVVPKAHLDRSRLVLLVQTPREAS